jgi:hypothetical protein
MDTDNIARCPRLDGLSTYEHCAQLGYTVAQDVERLLWNFIFPPHELARLDGVPADEKPWR